MIISGKSHPACQYAHRSGLDRFRSKEILHGSIFIAALEAIHDPIFVGLAALQPLSLACRADDKTGVATVENRSDGNALRMNVINAIANYINSAREATFNLEWNFLPETPALRLLAARTNTITIYLDNSTLGNDCWTGKIKDANAVKALKAALGLSPSGDLKDLLKDQLPGDYEATLKAAETKLGSSQIVTALMDHYALRFLLRSKGIRFYVTIQDAPVMGGGERTYDDQIRWKIKLYPTTENEVTFYRVSIKAELKRPETLTFPNSSLTKATIASTVSFKENSRFTAVSSDIAFGTGVINIAPTPAAADGTVTGQKLEAGGSTIEGVLDFVGGVKLADVVKSQLFGSGAQGRIFYGGLIGQGRIKQLIGVNQLLWSPNRNTSVGVLLGIAPDRNNGLFIGPSLQTGSLTLGAGAFALEQEKAGGGSDKTIKIQPAITLSIDMSKLIGGPQGRAGASARQERHRRPACRRGGPSLLRASSQRESIRHASRSRCRQSDRPIPSAPANHGVRQIRPRAETGRSQAKYRPAADRQQRLQRNVELRLARPVSDRARLFARRLFDLHHGSESARRGQADSLPHRHPRPSRAPAP